MRRWRRFGTAVSPLPRFNLLTLFQPKQYKHGYLLFYSFALVQELSKSVINQESGDLVKDPQELPKEL